MNRGVCILLLAASLVAGAATFVFSQTAAPPPAKPPAAAKPVGPVATVNGEVIAGPEFDALLANYLRQSRDVAKQAKQPFGKKEEQAAAASMLSGLINDRLWVQEARRQGISVPDTAVDGRIRRDPFFIVNGAFDEHRFQLFKTSPNSNYKDVFRRGRDILMVERLRGVLDKRYAPDEKKLYAEYLKQSQRHQMRYVWIRPDPTLLEGVLDRSEVEDYYKAHQAEFTTPERISVLLATYRVGTPHDTSWEESRAHAEALLDKLRHGAQLDSATAEGAAREHTGFLERGQAPQPLRHGASLTDSLFLLTHAQPYEKVVLAAEGYAVAVMDQRRSSEVRPLQDSWTGLYRSAMLLHRQKQEGEAARKLYQRDPSRYRTRAVHLKALYFDPRATHANGGSDAARADSLAQDAAATAFEAARRGKDVFSKAPRGAIARDYPHLVATSHDSVLGPGVADSAVTAPPGTVGRGPAAVRGRVVYKVLSADADYVPPFEDVESKARADVAEDRRKEKEAAALAYYQAHQSAYAGGKQYVLQYFLVPQVDAQDLHIGDPDIRDYYKAHIKDFSTEERFHLQAIVLNLRPNAPLPDVKRTQSKADSLVARARRGEDFGSLATQYSEDPPSARAGGDLGYLNREALRDPEVRQAVLAMKEGDVRGPLRGTRGFYIVKLLQHSAGVVEPFDKVHDKVYRSLVMERGDAAAKKLAAEIMINSKTPAQMDAEANKLGTSVSLSDPFEMEETVPGIGPAPEIKAELGSMKAGQMGKTPVKLPGGYVAWMLYEIHPAGTSKFEKVKERVMAQMDKDSMAVILKARVDTLTERLRHTSDLAAASFDLGKVQESGPFVRGFAFLTGIGSEALVDSFVGRAKPGEISGPITHPQGGFVVAQYEGPDPVDDKDYEQKKEQLKEQLVDQPERDLLAVLRRKARVRIFRPELRSAWQPVATAPETGGKKPNGPPQ